MLWTVVLEKTLESPLDCKEIQPVHSKGDQSWCSLEGLMLKLKLPILWPPDAKNWLTGKDSDAGRDWRRKEKGTTGWDGWMASLPRWTWVWVSSRSWWWTGRTGILQSMESQRVGHDWVTELNWTPKAVIHSLLSATSLHSLHACHSQLHSLGNLEAELLIHYLTIPVW